MADFTHPVSSGKPKKFWIILREDDTAYSRYTSDAEAKEEAIRKATSHKGTAFYVLKVTSAARTVPDPIELVEVE